jgi:sigma-E factor negative regulatory protein RseA
MSEQIREQVSAFLDGELPNSETELLLKRLMRDVELRESFGRYALMGECLRGGTHGRLSQGFTARVNAAIDGEPLAVSVPDAGSRPPRWWRPFAGAAVAAGVAALAVLGLQQRAVAPIVHGVLPVTAQTAGPNKPKEALSYTVPAMVTDAPTALPAARLTNYVFAHSKYSSVLGQENVLSGLLADADEPDWATERTRAERAAAERAASGSGEAAGNVAGRESKAAHDGTP